MRRNSQLPWNSSSLLLSELFANVSVSRLSLAKSMVAKRATATKQPTFSSKNNPLLLLLFMKQQIQVSCKNSSKKYFHPPLRSLPSSSRVTMLMFLNSEEYPGRLGDRNRNIARVGHVTS